MINIGIPALNRGDLLERLIESIDAPVERILIVANKWLNLENSLSKAIERISKREFRFGRVEIHEIDGNLGAAGSYNYLLKHLGPCIIASNDTCFTPGALSAAVKYIESIPDVPMHFLYARCMFHVSQLFLDRGGYFDENFWPWGWDDIDVGYRSVRVFGEVGRNLPQGYPKIIHDDPTQSINGWGESDSCISKWMRKASALNQSYGCRKWGILPQHHFMLNPKNRWSIDPNILYKLPFDGSLGARSLNDWVLDEGERLRRIADFAAETGLQTPLRYCFEASA